MAVAFIYAAFNGKACAVLLRVYPITNVQINACKQCGSLFHEGNWHYINWERDWPKAKHFHIDYKETLAILAAAIKWAPLWSNHKVIIHTDTTTAKVLINKGTS